MSWLRSQGGVILGGLLLGAVSLSLAAASGIDRRTPGFDELALEKQHLLPAIEALFLRESYRPGSVATLAVSSAGARVEVQIFRTGTEATRGQKRHEMRGVAVTEPRMVSLGADKQVEVAIGDWPSGVYYAELHARGRTGYAPLIVRPKQLGEQDVAIVMPTNTWFAYNRRDVDRDGDGDTWYENWTIRTVDMTRPFLDRGVPPNFNNYDLPFLRWLHLTGREVDVFSQRDLEGGLTGAELRRAYELIVFPGHHEYVTTREYDVIERYRDLGGNLMFLSANTFFWHTVKHGRIMRRTQHYHDRGRPESALVGVQFIAGGNGQHNAPYRLVPSEAGTWIFAGTGLEPGSSFGRFGIEIDHTTRFSPRGVDVVAEIRGLFKAGSAQMTYYETSHGAKVFAAGAFTLAGSALREPTSTILANLWEKLSQD
jgi:hypothetical protein